jgi:hypothetical protein
MAEKIALKPRKAVYPRRQKLLPRFHLLRHYATFLAAIAPDQGRARLCYHLGDVDFDKSGVGNESFPFVVRDKIVESDRISRLL